MRKKINKFVVIILLGTITIACKKPNLDSANQPPAKSTLVIANPMSLFNKLNSVNTFINVGVTVSVTALNSNTNQGQNYSTKTKYFTANSYGTPGYLTITDVNLPSMGPYTIDVFLDGDNCTIFPSLPSSCSVSKGAKPKYKGFKSVGVGTLTPAGTTFTINNSTYLTSFCCQ